MRVLVTNTVVYVVADDGKILQSVSREALEAKIGRKLNKGWVNK